MVSQWIEQQADALLNRVAFISARTIRTKASLPVLVESARNEAQSLTAEARRLAPPVQIACREGCDACCYQRVVVTGPEAIVIAAHIRATRSTEQLGSLAGALTAQLRRANRQPCPLLQQRRCTIYEHRPLRCQGHNGVDARQCHRLDHLVWLPQEISFRMASGGIAAGAARCGVGAGTYELRHALLIALTEKDAEARYLDGDDLFAPAALTVDDMTAEERAVEDVRIRREQRKS